jgi:plasmid stabilization system protein ParE
MAGYAFHPDALLEYAEATTYYLREASPEVAERFVAAFESAVKSIVAAPDRCRVVEHEFVTIFALMHCSRQPGFWKNRIA